MTDADSIREDTEHGAAALSIRALEILGDEANAAAADHAPDDQDRPSNDWEGVAAVARNLRDARPAMPVVANRINRVMATANEERSPAAVADAVTTERDRARDADANAAAAAAAHLPNRVGTLSRSGTVHSALEAADPAFVLVAESRPGREGVDTAERLANGTEAAVTLTTDAAFAERLTTLEVDALVVGADAILPDGSVVNKVGTRMAAAVATVEDVDSYVVAASDKIATDDTVDREVRTASELYEGDVDLSVENPTFDVTPADRIDAVLTERGPLDSNEVSEVAATHRRLANWDPE